MSDRQHDDLSIEKEMSRDTAESNNETIRKVLIKGEEPAQWLHYDGPIGPVRS